MFFKCAFTICFVPNFPPPKQTLVRLNNGNLCQPQTIQDMTFSLAIQLTIFYWLYFETFLKIKIASVPYHNIVLIIISPLIPNCDTNNTFLLLCSKNNRVIGHRGDFQIIFSSTFFSGKYRNFIISVGKLVTYVQESLRGLISWENP